MGRKDSWTLGDVRYQWGLVERIRNLWDQGGVGGGRWSCLDHGVSWSSSWVEGLLREARVGYGTKHGYQRRTYH